MAAEGKNKMITKQQPSEDRALRSTEPELAKYRYQNEPVTGALGTIRDADARPLEPLHVFRKMGSSDWN